MKGVSSKHSGFEAEIQAEKEKIIKLLEREQSLTEMKKSIDAEIEQLIRTSFR